jgi:hypothetical protein
MKNRPLYILKPAAYCRPEFGAGVWGFASAGRGSAPSPVPNRSGGRDNLGPPDSAWGESFGGLGSAAPGLCPRPHLRYPPSNSGRRFWERGRPRIPQPHLHAHNASMRAGPPALPTNTPPPAGHPRAPRPRVSAPTGREYDSPGQRLIRGRRPGLRGAQGV